MTIIQFQGQQQRSLTQELTREEDQHPPASRDMSLDINRVHDYDLTSIGYALLTNVLRLHADDIFVNYTIVRVIKQFVRNIASPENANSRESLGYKTFLALSTGYFGLEHGDPSVFTLGLRRYGHALENVRGALSEPSRYEFVDLLRSVVLLALFEVGCHLLIFLEGHCAILILVSSLYSSSPAETRITGYIITLVLRK